MSTKHLDKSRLMVVLLILGAPLMVGQVYRNQVEIASARNHLRQGLEQERESLAAEVVHAYFSQSWTKTRTRYSRSEQGAPIRGLAPMPDPVTFASWFPGPPEEQSSHPAVVPFVSWLESEARFFSGMPKKYAALVELLKCGESGQDALYRAAGDLWLGLDVDDATLGFLIQKLPDPLQPYFYEQLLYLGLVPVPEGEAVYVRLQDEARTALLQCQVQDLAELNLRLMGLGLGTEVRPSGEWRDFDGLSANLSFAPKLEPNRWGTILRYGMLLLAIELILVMLFWVLGRYRHLTRLQKQLLGAASHELRTPLAVMRQFTEMLVHQKQPKPERQARYLQQIHQATLRMQGLVENLLESAKYERFGSHAEATSYLLRPWLDELVRAVSHHWQGSAVHIHADGLDELEVCWDADKMHQALSNLLANAERHAGTDVDIHLSGYVHRSEDWLRLEVRDYGAGNLPSGWKPAAFGRGSGSKAGLGLGLFIVGKVVDAHRGRLELNPMNPGLAVVLHLPRRLPVQGGRT